MLDIRCYHLPMVAETKPETTEPHLSEALTEILQTAEETARGYNHHYVGSEHLVFALTDDAEVAATLGKLKVKPEQVREVVESYLKDVPSWTQSKIGLTYRVQNILADLTQSAANEGRLEITPVDLFRGIVGDKETVAAQILKPEPLKVTPGKLKRINFPPQTAIS